MFFGSSAEDGSPLTNASLSAVDEIQNQQKRKLQLKALRVKQLRKA